MHFYMSIGPDGKVSWSSADGVADLGAALAAGWEPRREVLSADGKTLLVVLWRAEPPRGGRGLATVPAGRFL